eukprot:TRINITY_DN1845_c0_g1_i1.p1 TRINITY_DN1845_c0_g1~~TRINITY_DN1845_c0_g1_i1.p1  ORF type:complete len:1226 (+),score=434.58 TRINITY_DN1845_c0_g1_i1:607-4284(+)
MMTPTSIRKILPRRGSSSSPPPTDKNAGKTLQIASASSPGSEATPYQPQRSSLQGMSPNNGQLVVPGAEDPEIWKRFRESGSLDEECLEKKDRAALIADIKNLDAELYEYQYNMGLLLIERKELTSKLEEAKLSVAEVEEKRKREQSAHLIAISEAEKREENLKKALGVEKQCVADLERALREMRTEHAEIKVNAENKLAEAREIVASTEEKSLRADSKLHSAEALQAEASRLRSETERKLQEIETLESTLRRERHSFKTECDARGSELACEKQNLLEWEKKLQEAQARLQEGQRFLNQKEEDVIKREEGFRKIEKELEQLRKRNERDLACLQEKEADISTRLSALIPREEEAVKRELFLSKREQELLVLQERLNNREKEEIQKLIDDQKAELNAKRAEFESELEEKRDQLEDELNKRKNAVEHMEADFNRKEERMNKREQQLEKKAENIKAKEKDVETRLKVVKEKEKSIKITEKEMEVEKKMMERERDDLVKQREELEKLRISLDEEKQKIQDELARLEFTDEERNEFFKLQTELKKEIEEYKNLKQEVENQAEELRLERWKFEKEWELLDARGEHLRKELAEVDEERKRITRLLKEEEERLKLEKKSLLEQFQNDSEALRVEKEAFKDTLESERSQLYENLRIEQADLQREIDCLRSELESGIEKKKEEMQRSLHEKEIEFQNKKERELQQIREEREIMLKELEEMRLERHKLEREKVDVEMNRERAEQEWSEIRNDIEELKLQREKLKEQRKSLLEEREEILRQCECLKKLQKDLNMPDNDLKHLVDSYGENPVSPSNISGKPDLDSAGRAGSSASKAPGRLSWIQKCASRLFSNTPSPQKVTDSDDQKLRTERPELPSREVENVTPEFENVTQDDDVGGEHEQHHSGATEHINLKGQVTKKMHDVSKARPSVNFDQSLPPSNGSFQKAEDKSKVKVFRRTHSIKAVVEDAKAILETSLDKEDDISGGDQQEEQNQTSMGRLISQGETEDNVDGRKESFTTDRVPSHSGRKRGRRPRGTMEHNEEDVEVESEFTIGGRKKKRRRESANTRSSVQQSPGGKRYNFRRSTIANATLSHTISTEEKGKGTSSQGKKGSKDIQENSSKGVAEVNQANSVEASRRHKGGIDSDNSPLKGEVSQIVQENDANGSAENFVEVSSHGMTKSETEEQYAESHEDEVATENAGVNVPDEDIEDFEEFDIDDDIEANENPSFGKKILNFLLS